MRACLRRALPADDNGAMENLGPTGQRSHAVSVIVDCPDCSTVRVPSTEIVVRWCADDQSCSYRTQCPRCGFAFVAATSETLAQTTIGAGARVEVWSRPAEVDERPAGPPIELADLLELHLALAEPDWFDELLGSLS